MSDTATATADKKTKRVEFHKVTLLEDWTSADGADFEKGTTLGLERDEAAELMLDGKAQRYQKAAASEPEWQQHVKDAIKSELAAIQKPTDAKAFTGADVKAARVEVGELAIMKDPKRGFRDKGEFFYGVFQKDASGHITEKMAAYTKAITGASIGVDSNLGILAPPEYSNRLLEKAYEETGVINHTFQMPISGSNVIKITYIN